ncbi:OstA-like protein [Algoriphagus vanfongensis]|uniref:OstA-like protein n=1 Tax=Algoriphagus vanfongensis TaxID=426371 RepID=UPI0004257DC8|nr:OstA-like protein [Algoriphagus vanfongensis]
MKLSYPFSILLFFWLASVEIVNAQDQKILNFNQADSLVGQNDFTRFLGNVVMTHQNTLIHCDSAHFFKSQNMAKFYGRVKIEDLEDPVTTTSAYAEYDGATKLAKLRNNVVFKNEETTLYTDFLNYDRAANVATYFNDGKVVDSTNVLTSERGRYDVNLEKITFQEDVVLVNPDYTLKTGHLIYLTIPKTAETIGLTNLVSKDGNTLDAQKGSFYDTQNKKFRFYDGVVETETSRVKAEELLYDELEAYYEGNENVRVFNKEREVEIFGDSGEFWENRGYSRVHGNALVRRYFEQDTLYLAADTLISQDHESDTARYLTAFRSIQLVKTSLSGIADSLVYNYNDSTIELFQDPVIWNEKSQISADSMVFFIENEELRRATMTKNAFAVMTDTLFNYNQMKGRRLMAFFDAGQISRLDIDGNGESLYYALEGDSLNQGINRTLSATISMRFKEGAIQRVNYGVKPDGKFIPVQLVNDETSKLEGFQWRLEEKPDMEDIDAWRKVVEIDLNEKNLFNEPDAEIRMPTDEEIRKSLEKKGLSTEKSGLSPLKRINNLPNDQMPEKF